MRAILIFLLAMSCGATIAQKKCFHHSRLFVFDNSLTPKVFTDPLGRKPQFPFLQQMNGITSAELFVQSINDPAKQALYTREFQAFDLLLRNAGFWHGYKDLNVKNVKNVFITPGTIGNLGFYDKQKDLINYEYVTLNPAGELPQGVAAWKLTNASGCFLYILHTCGNAWYPNDFASADNSTRQPDDADGSHGAKGQPGVRVEPGVNRNNSNNGNCCNTLVIKTSLTPAPQKSDSLIRPVDLRMNYYQAKIVSSRKKGHRYDTSYALIQTKDTLVYFKDRLIVPSTLDSSVKLKIFSFCKDSMATMKIALAADSANQTDHTMALRVLMADTSFEKKISKVEPKDCDNKWEISVEAGKSFNSIPRLNDPTQHTQTNGSKTTATLEISRIMAPWFQLGLSASYVILSYQDDINYPGNIAGTYNTVYLGKPIIPVQLFGKFNFGKPVGWETSLSLSLGYSIPTNGKIEDNGTTLSTKPNLKGDFTAGLKFGVAYFFSCHIGLGASFTGQYFNNKSDLTNYSLYALPVQGGIHFRF